MYMNLFSARSAKSRFNVPDPRCLAPAFLCAVILGHWKSPIVIARVYLIVRVFGRRMLWEAGPARHDVQRGIQVRLNALQLRHLQKISRRDVRLGRSSEGCGSGQGAS